MAVVFADTSGLYAVLVETDRAHAIHALLAAGRRGVPLTDWTSFQVIPARRIHLASAADPDFEAQGFEVLSAPKES